LLLSVPSYSQKLNRASEHIEDLGIVQDTWLGTSAYTFVTERNPQTRQTIVRAKIAEPPPAKFALIAGDAVHALRASLDHLALELAVVNHRPNPVPSVAEKASEFPIFPSKVGDDLGSDIFHRVKKKTGEPAPGSGLYKLQGAHPDAIKAIEGIQPYHRGTADTEDPLWLIHELDRIDKHRRLHFTAYTLGSVGIGAGPSGSAYMGDVHFEKMGHSGPVEDGTPVAIFTASDDSYFQLNFSRQITLMEPTLPQGTELAQILRSLRDCVRDEVVPLLKCFL
jgi:hypothetical protein